ncbi:Putative ribosomal N-lysine methyltransferase [Podospora comata]|uniref:Ribosomal N-lysine methyltransferase n=1 Tax=Podospora comata TaxID=48703 RepID=A0ABY6RYB8_PODCO|nr:Putative ribosomal N-lysine methyltransferase [Podospora comata]
MEAYDELLRWASKQGIEVHGIEAKRIPGRGIGIVASKDLKANERLIYVPAASLRTLTTVRPEIRKALPPPAPKYKGTSVHALLAAELLLETPTIKKKYAPWHAVVPTRDDILSTLPLAWPTSDHEKLHSLLPYAARAHLTKQKAKFEKDWQLTRDVLLPKLSLSPKGRYSKQEFLYHWLLVNTRTFYHETPATERLTKDDKMALQPVADLLNHSDEGCEVVFDTGCYTISADREYKQGEEVYICYGTHSNDFLMVEYGFCPEENKWDEVCIDEVVLEEMSTARKKWLDGRDFLGKYLIDERNLTGCYRTRVALMLLCTSRGQWERWVDEGEDGGGEVQKMVDRIMVRVLEKYLKRCMEAIEELEGCGPSGEMVLRRWRQIERLVKKSLEELKVEDN